MDGRTAEMSLWCLPGALYRLRARSRGVLVMSHDWCPLVPAAAPDQITARPDTRGRFVRHPHLVRAGVRARRRRFRTGPAEVRGHGWPRAGGDLGSAPVTAAPAGGLSVGRWRRAAQRRIWSRIGCRGTEHRWMASAAPRSRKAELPYLHEPERASITQTVREPGVLLTPWTRGLPDKLRELRCLNTFPPCFILRLRWFWRIAISVF